MQSTCGIGGGELVSRLAGEAVDSLTECDAGVGRGVWAGEDWTGRLSGPQRNSAARLGHDLFGIVTLPLHPESPARYGLLRLS